MPRRSLKSGSWEARRPRLTRSSISMWARGRNVVGRVAMIPVCSRSAYRASLYPRSPWSTSRLFQAGPPERQGAFMRRHGRPMITRFPHPAFRWNRRFPESPDRECGSRCTPSRRRPRRPGPHALQAFHDLELRQAPGPLRGDLVDLVVVRETIAVGGEAGLPRELRLADEAAQRRPLLVIPHRHDAPLIVAGTRVAPLRGMRRMAVPETLPDTVVRQPVENVLADRVAPQLIHADIDPEPLPAPMAVPEGQRYPHETRPAGQEVHVGLPALRNAPRYPVTGEAGWLPACGRRYCEYAGAGPIAGVDTMMMSGFSAFMLG